MEIGDYRLIKKGHKVWSINNQMDIKLTEDVVVKINHTTTDSSNLLFVQPMEVIFSLAGNIPSLIKKGTDEWAVLYTRTEPYEIPNNQVLNWEFEPPKVIDHVNLIKPIPNTPEEIERFEEMQKSMVDLVKKFRSSMMIPKKYFGKDLDNQD